jgi:hypothetical protein
VIAAVSYEILRWGARHREHSIVRWIFLPGIWLQGITTKQPDDSMIEIAIASLQEALAANGDAAPEGSWDPEREPIPDARRLAEDIESRSADVETADEPDADDGSVASRTGGATAEGA